MQTKQKLLVVGSSGYIGKSLINRAPSNFDLYKTSSSDSLGTLSLDLSSPLKFDYSQIGSLDIVLLMAAISSPDVCANQHDYAWSVNVKGTSEFISNVIDRGARVIFFSSDTVYGERSVSFDENAECQPAGEYAEMKHEVEKKFSREKSFKSIRLSYVFSHEDKFTKYLVGCEARGEEAELFHPFFRAIVHRGDVVEGALALAERWNEFPQQIINFGGPAVISRIEFAECVKTHVLPNLQFRVSEPDDIFFKNRPRSIAMKSIVLPILLGRAAYTLAEAVKIEFNKNK
jgi:dTDP-4-dehydrorhamnose reductase